LINFEKAEVEDLARRCVRVARAKIGFIFEESVPVEINFSGSYRSVPSAARLT
jgi:hypothetical protein